MNLICSILCATGYAEESVRQASVFLRRRGIRVVFLGLKSGAIIGAAGATLVPTALLSRFIHDEAESLLPDGLLIAGGMVTGQQLLADPRVHRFIKTMSLTSKPVGFLYPVSYPLVALLNQQMVPNPFLLQEHRATADFLHRFRQQLQRLGTVAEPKLASPCI